MDWPHDPDAPEASDGGRKYGMAIIAKKLDDEADFPLEREAFVEEYGDDPIRINHETVVPLRDIFEHVEPDSFDTIVDLHKAVGAAMRAGDFWTYHPSGQDPEQKSA
ncbi:MAG: DUF5785 family protein [Natrialbaceae archaeon]|nr:DUF5785 family protein [Natrialbaceae archaeon]